MDIVSNGLEAWFAERLRGMPYRPETIAYVAGVLKTLGHPREGDVLGTGSVVLAYQDASARSDFAAYQRIGDWILWVDVVMPDRFNSNRTTVETIGRLSYYACHRILRGQWALFEELADALPEIALDARRKLV